MKQEYNVLTIDDHQIILDTYKNAFNFVKESLNNVDFIIDEAKNCDEALVKIKTMSSTNFMNIIVLDISLPKSRDNKIFSGEDLGKMIKSKIPNAKLIVSTSFNDNLRLNSIMRGLNPEGFLVKGDIGFGDIVNCIKKVMSHETYYSNTVLNFLRKKAINTIVLDDIDIKILYEISNGARMKELLKEIPLTKTGIEKRKRILKSSFNVVSNSDRDLVLIARERGFI